MFKNLTETICHVLTLLQGMHSKGMDLYQGRLPHLDFRKYIILSILSLIQSFIYLKGQHIN